MPSIDLTPEAFIDLVNSIDVEDRIRESHDPNVKACAVFDADGTLWHDDLTVTMIMDRADESNFPPELLKKYQRIIDDFGLEPATDVSSAYETISKAFWSGKLYEIGKNKGIPRDQVLQMGMPAGEFLMTGLTEAELKQRAKTLFEQDFKDYIYVGAREMIDALQNRGFEVYIISAGLDDAVVVGTQYVASIDSSHVNGMRLKKNEQGQYIPEVELPMTIYEGKAEVARQVCDGRPFFAFGDSVSTSDKDMLLDALIPVAVEPKDTHAKYAKEQGMMIIDYTQKVDGSPANTYFSPRDVQ